MAKKKVTTKKSKSEKKKERKGNDALKGTSTPKGTKEKVCEIFEVGKKGKEKEVVACGNVEKNASTPEQIAHQNKILKGLFIAIVLIVVLIFGAIYFINNVENFNYRGVKGKVIQEGKLIFYEIEFPYLQKGKIIPYYIYIRNDPSRLDKQVPFNGEMDFGDIFNVDNRYRLIINSEEEFVCDGHGVIALANMNNLEALKIRKSITTKDSNITCDDEGRYMFLNIISGNKTEINQIGNACYELTVNDCEILKGTERFMTEAFVYYYDNLVL